MQILMSSKCYSICILFLHIWFNFIIFLFRHSKVQFPLQNLVFGNSDRVEFFMSLILKLFWDKLHPKIWRMDRKLSYSSPKNPLFLGLGLKLNWNVQVMDFTFFSRASECWISIQNLQVGLLCFPANFGF